MNNKTFRLFVSSTFEDFHEERELLNNNIVKRLDDYCKQFGYTFQLVDLRWGINNESALNQRTLEICLNEVKRCRTLSPKPNFLLMIGNRYGWTPLPSAIDKNEFEAILYHCNDSQRESLSQWYLLNENLIPSKYQLKTRSGAYVDDDVWNETEITIREIFQAVLPLCNFSSNLLFKYETSATEQEIMEGVFYDESDSTNAIALFRNDSNETKENEKISRLKKRITDKMTIDGCEEDIIRLNTGHHYLNQFNSIIFDKLKAHIESEISRLENTKKLSSTDAVLENYKEGIEKTYFREAELNYIQQFLESNTDNVLFLYGESGSGKTTVLAKAVSQCDHSIFCGFYGTDDYSFSIFDATLRICKEICEQFDISNEVQLGYQSICENFSNTFSAVPESEKILIVLDGIESMYDIHDLREQIIPFSLNPNIKFIVSSYDSKIINIVSSQFNTLQITHFNSQRSAETLEWLLISRSFHLANQTQKELCKQVLSNGANPLLVKLLADYCSVWKSYDNNIHISDSAEQIILDFIEYLYTECGHNKSMVLYSLAMIAASPYGITEYELQKLLFSIEDVKKYFNKEKRHVYVGDILPFAIWSRLCYDLERNLTFAFFDGDIVIRFSHQVFYTTIKKYFPSEFNTASSTLIDYYRNAPTYIFTDERIPNSRKCRLYPLMLKMNGRNDDLIELYSNLEFIDASIKCGNLDSIIQNIVYLKENIAIRESYLNKIFETLSINYPTLSVYKNEFFNLYSDSGYLPIIQKSKTEELTKSRFLQISALSNIAYSAENNLFAYSTDSFVYVYDYLTMLEKHRIFVKHGEFSESSISKIDWISHCELLVCMEKKQLLIYDLSDNHPVLYDIISNESEMHNIQISSKNRLIFYLNKNRVICYSIDKKSIVYSIPISTHIFNNETPFEVSDESNCLYIKRRKKLLACHNITNGQQLNTQSIRSFKKAYQTNRVRHLSNESFILYKEPTLYALYIKDKANFICPPSIIELRHCLIGKSNIIFIYEWGLLLFNFMNNTSSFYYTDRKCNICWKDMDESLIAISQGSISEISVYEFTKLPSDLTLLYKYNVLTDSIVSNRILSKDFGVLRKLIHSLYLNSEVLLTYSSLNEILFNNELLLNGEFLVANKNTTAATLYVESPAGYKAIAYEKADTITVEAYNYSFEIRKLNLAIDNNILKIAFSNDSNWLLVWMNQQLLVFNLVKRTKYLDINLKKTPIISAAFSDDNQNILLTLPNNKVFHSKLDIIRKHGKIIGKFEKNNNELYGYPFVTSVSSDKTLKAYSLINSKTYMKTIPSRWFLYRGSYKNEQVTIDYDKGYFMTVDNIKYQSTGFNFVKSTDAERNADTPVFNGYLREKNTLMSPLISLNKQYAVLIHIPTNSIIVFDVVKHKVISAVKHSVPIIGGKKEEKNTISVYSNQRPYRCIYQINLPNT